MIKAKLHKIVFLVAFWLLCSTFIIFYNAAFLDFQSEFGGDSSFIESLLIVLLITLIGSSILGSLDVLLLSKVLRKKPFGISILIRAIIYMLFIIVFVSAAILFVIQGELNQALFSEEVLNALGSYLLSPRIIMNFVFWAGACITALFILQVSEKFGQGVLINFLMGKYHKPKEELKIFMFMDLKSSTSYAEQLGHIRYSELIQDCYFDLTNVVLKYRAFIYQYVGDEVVLAWDEIKGLKDSNCIKMYLDYDKKIKNRAEHYQEKYGLIPEFKAGVDIGYATVAEVGQIKKELAYHGDVLNTASRIQSKCNEFNTRLLISERLWTKLGDKTKDNFNRIGNVSLKGKQQSVNIYNYIG